MVQSSLRTGDIKIDISSQKIGHENYWVKLRSWFKMIILGSFKVRLLLGFRKTPKPYELYNRYHQEFHAPHCDRGHGQVRVVLDYPAGGHNVWTTDTPPKGHSVQSSNSNNHNCFLKQVMTHKNDSHKILHEMSIKYKQLFPNIV